MWFVWSYIKETEATTDRRALTQFNITSWTRMDKDVCVVNIGHG